MATVVLSAFILLFYVYRRRESEDLEDEEPAPRPKPVSMSAVALIKAAQKAAVASANNVQPRYAPIGAAQATAAARGPPKRQEVAPAQTPKREAFSLLDAIPAIRVRAEELSDAGYKAFMSQLEGLQHEMTELQRKRSIFPEPEDRHAPGIEKELDLEGPRVIRGLQLKTMLQ
jgi:hypothetical protein